jgi:phospholipid/cholesterol/gamma-HCH transport system permease protein
MQVMGLEPMELLGIPRVLALMIMLPILIIVANVAAILGGAIASWVTMDLDFTAFATRMQATADINNFYIGLIKAPFFAATIALVGCFHGYQVTGSAESVGRLTTQSVVKSIFLVIIIDALFAIFFSIIGI